MKAFALKFVRFDRIEDHMRQGWMVMIPNGAMHHHHYGVELKWICECPIPGLKSVSRRVQPITNKERENERARA
jgi:hypothetical protein